jgi:hypothetical protein
MCHPDCGLAVYEVDDTVRDGLDGKAVEELSGSRCPAGPEVLGLGTTIELLEPEILTDQVFPARGFVVRGNAEADETLVTQAVDLA